MPSSSDQTRVGRTLTLGGGAEASPEAETSNSRSPSSSESAANQGAGFAVLLNFVGAGVLDNFRQQAIAGVLNGAAPVLFDLRINQPPEMRCKALVRTFLVHSHQPRVTDHIGGETAFDGLFHGLPQPRDHSRTLTLGTEGKSHVRRRPWSAGAAHLRKIGRAPQVTTPKLGRNSGKFQTAVWDIVWRIETRTGRIGEGGMRRPAGTARNHLRATR
jgi:hypothetical protein